VRTRLLAVALVLAAGCGADDEPAVLATSSSTSTTAPAPVPTTCPVEDGAVASAVGAPVTQTFVANARSATCTWTFDGGGVTLNLERGGGADAHEQYEQIADTDAVAGLGDEATWVPAQRVLSVLDGSDVYMVLVEGIDDPLAVATEVARLALAGS
jgi:hypothetical protein